MPVYQVDHNLLLAVSYPRCVDWLALPRVTAMRSNIIQPFVDSLVFLAVDLKPDSVQYHSHSLPYLLQISSLLGSCQT